MELRGNDDALLLLAAICNDLLHAHLIASNLVHGPNPAQSAFGSVPNAYVPLSPESEAIRVRHIFDVALKRWHQHFGETASADVMAFFYFCRLLVSTPEILYLPSYAVYPTPALSCGAPITTCSQKDLIITDEAVNFAWLILDNASDGTDAEHDDKFSIWLPVALFYAALTVWHRLAYPSDSTDLRSGTLRCLNMFTAKLRVLPWPCCPAMSLTIDKLASA